MKKDWRYDRITQLKATLSDVLTKCEDKVLTEEDITQAKNVLNENRQLMLAAEKAAKFEQF